MITLAQTYCKIYCRGIGANINNTSANVTSLMRGNYSGTEVFCVLHAIIALVGNTDLAEMKCK